MLLRPNSRLRQCGGRVGTGSRGGGVRAAWTPESVGLTYYSRLGGVSDRVRPARYGNPAVSVRGTPSTGVGRLGPCLSLGGSAAVAVGPGYAGGLNVPRFSGDWTMSLDFYLNSLPSLGSRMQLLSMDLLGQYRQMEWYVITGSGPLTYPQVNFWLDQSTSRTVRIYPPSPNLTTGTWYTLCLRYQASDSTYTIDCNGQTDSVTRNTATGLAASTGPINYDANNSNTIVLGSIYDQLNGWRFGLNGRLESLRCYSRRLSDAEVATLSAGYDPYPAESGTQMVVCDPQPYQVAKKDGSGQGSLRVTGYLRGDALTPTDIQWSWNGSAWADMSATIDGTARTFDGTITLVPAGSNPSDRQGTLSLRAKNDTSVTATVAGVGVGYVFGIWGQSNAAGAYPSPQPYSTSNGLSAGVFDFSYTGRLLEESAELYNLHATGARAWVDGTSETYQQGSQWPRFAALWADRTGWPVMIVPAAVSGSSINGLSSNIGGWNPTLSPFGRSRLFNNYNVLKRRCLYVGGVTAVIGQQGEQDAATSMTAATYQGHFETLGDAIGTDLSCKILNSTLPSGLSGAAAINTGVTDAAAANVNIEVGPDLSGRPYDESPHWTTDASAIAIAAAWDARLAALGYDS